MRQSQLKENFAQSRCARAGQHLGQQVHSMRSSGAAGHGACGCRRSLYAIPTCHQRRAALASVPPRSTPPPQARAHGNEGAADPPDRPEMAEAIMILGNERALKDDVLGHCPKFCFLPRLTIRQRPARGFCTPFRGFRSGMSVRLSRCCCRDPAAMIKWPTGFVIGISVIIF